MVCTCTWIGSTIISNSIACPIHPVNASDEEILTAEEELARLKHKIREAKKNSHLVNIDGRNMVAVPYWFMKL